MERKLDVNRGDIFMYDFGDGAGSIQGKMRAAVVVSNSLANRFSPVILVSPITSQIGNKKALPTHVKIEDHKACGLLKESQVLCEQIFSINKADLIKYIGKINHNDMIRLNTALEISIEVGEAVGKFKSWEIQKAKEKADAICEIDKFIQMWLNKKKSVSDIYEFIEERKARIEDIKKFCIEYKLKYNDFYRDNMMGYKEKRMVG